ncbi:hypothetical protein [Peribacillus sp. FSL E2-0218]|uniref:hypothetical protein n=1 Tax=Peribacillus sp. FSL E2-0218 TaxID=2921364 RepID=UPI0030EC3958
MYSSDYTPLSKIFFSLAGIAAICLLILLLFMKITELKKNAVKRKRINYKRLIFRYYQREDLSRYKLYKLRKILIKMDRSYTKEFDYINIQSSQFMKEPEVIIDSKIVDKRLEYYKSNKIYLKKEALENIKDLLKKKSVLIKVKEYYQVQERNAAYTKLILRRDSRYYGFEELFKDIFIQRIIYLSKIVEQCKLIQNELALNIVECEENIRRNERNVKFDVVGKIIETTFSIITAPIRHGANLVNGIATGDSKKAWKSGAMLGLTVVGIGAVGDALDVLDGLDSIDLSTDLPSGEQEFVRPFDRTLEDGTTIWVDGDGDTNTDLTVEEGGGFTRN